MECGHWFTENSDNFDPSEYFGMVYLIENIATGRKYVGKKQFHSRRRKKIIGRKNRKVHVSESNWREYTGSCNELNEDIERLGKDKFKFTILRLCKTKRDWSYGEIEEQVTRKVLDALLEDGTREYYNANIMSRWFVTTEKIHKKISNTLIRKYANGYINPMAGRIGPNKGKPTWNKGLTKDTDVRVKRNGMAIRKRDGRLGRPPWNKGLTNADPRVAKYVMAHIKKNGVNK